MSKILYKNFCRKTNCFLSAKMRKFSYVVRLFAVIGELFVIVFEFVVCAVKYESRAAREHYRVNLLCGFFAFQKVCLSCLARLL